MKYKQLIEKMTLEEKASLMSGGNFWNTKSIERLDIPSIMLTDGPHGLRKQGGKADHIGLNKSLPATCFPTAATLANSWDKKLIYDVGSHIGKEAASENVSVLLGPGLNIKRNPLCGRNFEYFSEDPYLTGELASEMVKGIQSQGISACPKHFAVNSQEHMRMTIDEIVDERSLREIYLEAFRKVVESSEPKTIMTSYNKVNGTYANENQHIMNDILYDEWKFDGVAVTDWGGNNERVAGLKAGNQLEMPSTNGITDGEIVEAIKTNHLPEDVLDDAVNRVLDLIFSTKQEGETTNVDFDEQHEFAIDAAQRSIVMLKNEDKILPIDLSRKIAIIGDFAEIPRYQGAGSSLINPAKLTNAVDVLNKTSLNLVGYAKGFIRKGGRSNKLLNEAVSLAHKADKILLFLGLDESSEAEGIDRKDLKLPENQLTLLKKIQKVNPNIVVILSGGGAIEIPFEQQVKGILHSYLSGQGSAEAIKSILLGDYNPSGKLSETFPLKYEDVSSAPYFPGKEATSEHREGIFVGYRYFDTANVPVLYPFGYGLSYTKFAYSDIEIDDLEVSFTLKNIGEVAGEEVAQLYIKKKNSQIFRAKRELKGFEKIYLGPNETKKVTINLEEKDFAYYHTANKAWEVEPGEYEIQVGSSIENIHLQSLVKMTSEEQPLVYTKEKYPNYFNGKVHDVSDQEFHNLLGYEPPSPFWDKQKDLGMNDTIAQAKYKNWVGKLVYNLVMLSKKILEKLNKPLAANNVFIVLNMPFRQIERFSGGKLSRRKIERFLKWIN
ncbi:beta-glucosidase family protein [Salipaludibacillus sp. HK11]|uniref:beta-glucosidase n=1 Tax=Salipaludibacillus sp. HK11 TaxID=3394320 RepID=UPI0039FDC0A4